MSHRSVEYNLRNLSALYSRAISAVRTALELKCDVPIDGDIGEAVLSEIAELLAVKNGRRRVEGVRFDLNRVLEVHIECITGTVGEELRVVFGQHFTHSFQFDLHFIVCGAVRRPVETEPDYEYPFIDTKLN